MKSKTILLSLAVVILIAPSQATAASKSASTTGSQASSGVTAKKTFSDKCANVQTKLKTKAQNHGLSKEKHLSVYNNLQNRLTKFAARAKSAGYDTSKLESDLVELKARVNTFKLSTEEYDKSVAQLKTNICGRPEDTFRNDLSQTKELLKNVHANAALIRKFVQETIKVDLQALKKRESTDNQTTTSGAAAGTSGSEDDSDNN
ncbi:MAG: hypothetical protein WCT32_01120 [Patescibacteria group bacterium]|jgi:hypothetical protein